VCRNEQRRAENHNSGEHGNPEPTGAIGVVLHVGVVVGGASMMMMRIASEICPLRVRAVARHDKDLRAPHALLVKASCPKVKEGSRGSFFFKKKGATFLFFRDA
jgi:hypothetical protein